MTFSRASIVLFLLLIFFSCQEERKVYHDLSLKGSVKNVKERHYEAIEKFGEITAGNRTDIGSDLFYKMEIKDPLSFYSLQEKEYFLNPIYATSELQKSKMIEVLRNKEYDLFFSKEKNLRQIKILNSNDRIEQEIFFNSINKIGEYNEYKSKSLEAKVIYTYSSNGDLTSRIIYDRNGNEINIQKLKHTDSLIAETYFQDGKLMAKTSMSYNAPDKPQKFTVQFFDNNSQVIGSEDNEYTYDRKGNLLKTLKNTNDNTSLNNSVLIDRRLASYKYDHQNNLKEAYYERMNNQNEEDHYIESFFKYDYRDNNLKKISIQVVVKKNGEEINKEMFDYLYSYDENNMIMEKQIFQNDELKGKGIFEYTLDENNNWIECIYSIGNQDKLPKAAYVLKRDIEYY